MSATKVNSLTNTRIDLSTSLIRFKFRQSNHVTYYLAPWRHSIGIDIEEKYQCLTRYRIDGKPISAHLYPLLTILPQGETCRPCFKKELIFSRESNQLAIIFCEPIITANGRRTFWKLLVGLPTSGKLLVLIIVTSWQKFCIAGRSVVEFERRRQTQDRITDWITGQKTRVFEEIKILRYVKDAVHLRKPIFSFLYQTNH